jgi:hypothetical protein
VEVSPLESFAMDIQATVNTYDLVMNTIKLRHKILLDLVTANPRPFPDWACYEFAMLEVRMICETFAIGCLVAHGDIQATRSGRLPHTYQADLIINTLEKLHPNFYPRPTQQIVENGVVTGWREILDGYLTQEDLVKSYRRAANFLHVSDLRDILAGKQKPFDLNSVLLWANKVVVLLNHHNIFLIDPPDVITPVGPDGTPMPQRQIVSVMNPRDQGVTVHWMHRADTVAGFRSD